MDYVLRGVLKRSTENQKRVVDCEILHNENQKNIEHFEPYGFTSQPVPNAEVLLLCFDGDRAHVVTPCITDKRYRPKVQEGEVCIFDNLGRKIYLKKDGILIDGNASNITITTSANVQINCANATVKAQNVTIDAPQTECTGNLTVKGTISANDGTCRMEGGNITTSGDVVADNISLKNHTHTEQGDGQETSTAH